MPVLVDHSSIGLAYGVAETWAIQKRVLSLSAEIVIEVHVAYAVVPHISVYHLLAVHL